MSLYPPTNQGLAQYQEGQPFEAHEAFEAAWLTATGPEKAMLQTLVQICAATHKANEGNFRGVVKLLTRAQTRLAEHLNLGSCLGIDLVAVKAEVDRALAHARAPDEPPWIAPRLPPRTDEARIVYLHGFASSPKSTKAQRIVPQLQAAGAPVEVPDLNEDDFEHLTVTRALTRIRRCLADRTLIMGSSLGGYLAALLASQDSRVQALVLMAPAFDFAGRLQTRYGEATLEQWKKDGQTLVDHYGYGTPRPIGYALYEDALTHPPRPPLKVPTYVLQGEHDDVVPADMVRQVLQTAGPHVTLNVVDDDHTLVNHAKDAEKAALRLWQDISAL